jgi:hypothetical protein
MKIVAENDQAYLIKDSKVVAAFTIEDIDALPEPVEPVFEIGTRVAYNKKLGTIITRDVSMYGPFFGIKFDDGSLGEYEASDLTTSVVPSPNFDSPIEEIRAEWQEYQDMPKDTLDQIETKSSVARSLALRAKALKTDKNTAFSDSILLDKVATATEVDLLDLKTAKDVLTSNDEFGDYLAGLPTKAELKTIRTGADEDVSWLQDMDPVDEEERKVEITTLASAMVRKFTKEELENEEFIRTAIGYQISDLNLNEDEVKYFEDTLKEASKEKLAQVVEKTASVEEEPFDLENYDAEELYN